MTNVSLLKSRFSELVTSLLQGGVYDAEYDIALPLEGTCDWIFDVPAFESWLDVSGPSKVFLVNGKIGSGKSTLTRHVVETLKSDWKGKERHVVPFFVPSSGSATPRLATSTLFRSLLVQILHIGSFRKDAMGLAHKHALKRLRSQGTKWHPRELQEAFIHMFQKPRSDQTVIFIDGIDKCTEPEDLSRFILDLSSLALPKTLKVYLTSQDTSPAMDSQYSQITMEDFNQGDIAHYVQKRILTGNTLNQDQLFSLRQSIMDKAAGVFIWVVLVVDILQKHINNGRDFNFLYAALDDTPKQLRELYRNILLEPIEPLSPFEVRSLIRTMQWILFSARPLSLSEWHHVFAFIDKPSLRSIKHWEWSASYTQSDSLLIQRINRICRGLVDVKDREARLKPSSVHSEESFHFAEDISLRPGAGSFESHQYINVIHSSVRTFFLDEDGFTLLDPDILNPGGEGQLYILEVCIRYSFLEEMKSAFQVQQRKVFFRVSSSEPTDDESDEDEEGRRMSLGSSAGSSMSSFYVNRNNGKLGDRKGRKLESPKRKKSEIRKSKKLGSVKSKKLGRVKSKKVENRKREKLERKPAKSPSSLSQTVGYDFTVDPSIYESAFSQNIVLDYLDQLEIPSSSISTGSLARTHSNASSARSITFRRVRDPPDLWHYCQSMVIYHAVAADREAIIPESALDFLVSQDWDTWAAAHGNMQCGASIEYFAAQWDLVTWLQYLARGRDAQFNSKSGQHDYPIIVAARMGSKNAFKFLFSRFPLCIDRRDRFGRTAIHYAALHTDTTILDQIYNQFSMRIDLESVEETRLGMKQETQWIWVNTVIQFKDVADQSALHLAARYGPSKSVKQLINLGANVDAKQEDDNTPLHMACLRDIPDQAICVLLLDANCDVSTRNRDGLEAMDIASQRCHLEIVELLKTRRKPLFESANSSPSSIGGAKISSSDEILDLATRS